MSDTKKKKQEHSLSVKETAEKLRTLADELGSGVVSVNGEKYSLSPETRIKIDLKTKSNKLSLKLKCSLAGYPVPEKERDNSDQTDTVHTDRSEEITRQREQSRKKVSEEYTILKKRMAKDFSTLMKRCVKEHMLPEPALIERFCQDSKAMCTYPDKGEEFYEAYLKQAESLSEAFRISDLQAVSEAVSALGLLRKECHERYK